MNQKPIKNKQIMKKPKRKCAKIKTILDRITN